MRSQAAAGLYSAWIPKVRSLRSSPAHDAAGRKRSLSRRSSRRDAFTRDLVRYLLCSAYLLTIGFILMQVGRISRDHGRGGVDPSSYRGSRRGFMADWLAGTAGISTAPGQLCWLL